MNNIIDNLKLKIDKSLSNILLKKCLLLDAPFYENVGDVLIYEGEKALFKKYNITIVGIYSHKTFKPINIDNETFIAINGGGNMGDIYPEHLKFLESILLLYPNNRIIVFPQTFYFQNKDEENRILSNLSRFENLYICSRDTRSYNIVSKYFKNAGQSLLVPDMAFFIDRNVLLKYVETTTKKVLFIKRVDAEQTNRNNITNNISVNISDWPSFQHSIKKASLIAKILNNLYDKLEIKIIRHLINIVWNKYFPIHCRLMVEEGVKFISPYETIHTTRLHGAILSILLDKDVYIYDNSYGKNFYFYDTWLKNNSSIHFVRN